MKDRISHVHARPNPYAVTPRRPLHYAESSTFGGRVVRAAPPYVCEPPMVWQSTHAGQPTTDARCITTSLPRRTFKPTQTVAALPLNDTNYYPDRPVGLLKACAQIACENGLTDVVAVASPYTAENPFCCVAAPPQRWTKQPGASLVRQSPSQDIRFRGIDGTEEFTPNTAECADSFGVTGAQRFDSVEPAECRNGTLDRAVALKIQCQVGLETGPICNDRSSSTAPTPTPTQRQTPNTQTGSGATLVTGAGILSTLAAFVTPAVPTVAIAAAAPVTTITGLAIGLGIAGSGLVLGAAVIASYKLGQYCKPKNQIRPSHQLNFSRRELSQFELTDTAITNYSDPMEEPADTATLASAQDLGREVHLRVGTERSTHVDLSTIDLNNHILAIPRRLLENPAIQTRTLSRTPTPINVNVHLSDSELNEHIAVGERIIASPRPVLDNPFGPPLQNVSLI